MTFCNRACGGCQVQFSPQQPREGGEGESDYQLMSSPARTRSNFLPDPVRTNRRYYKLSSRIVSAINEYHVLLELPGDVLVPDGR